MTNILVAEDSARVSELIVDTISSDGVNVLVAHDSASAWEIIQSKRPDVVLLDLIMPGIGGMELLEKTMRLNPMTSVVILTGEQRVDYAVEALQKGACDYLTKPFDVDTLKRRTDALVAEAQHLRQTTPGNPAVGKEDGPEREMVGQSPEMLTVFSRLRQVAPHFRSVLITADTGTGKELAARALHRLSPAAKGPFVECNCAAIVDTLFESQLFGYVKGAFTGATRDHAGLFEQADGGTLFLDEIGELPLALQSKLLRVLQEWAVQRVGSHSVRKVNVRVIAATNRNLQEMALVRLFREDLYYRLAMVKVRLPRLAERISDLPLLERHFIGKYSAQFGKNIRGVTPRVSMLLERYPWPGNVRELENAIANACMVCTGDVIDVRHLPEELQLQGAEKETTPGSGSQNQTMAEMEYRQTLLVLKECGGNKLEAANRLGVSRNTLYRILSRANAAGQGSA